jgi:hypothetical protein
MGRCLRSTRTLEPELLDLLEADDPRARHSRRDLRKVNMLMGHPWIVTRTLAATPVPGVVVELGAGDGTFLLKVAERLGCARARIRAILVDRHPSVSPHTCARFREIGWDVEPRRVDVFDYLHGADAPLADVTLATLFLHHFDASDLSALLLAVSKRTKRFVACEPRRSRTALAGAWMLRFLDCNDVTQHDAAISVKAGFRDREISALWPRDREWRLDERRRGAFSHWFVAHHDTVV